jgi:3-deoxy-D-manno-octulosonic-acid transferase
MRALYAAASYLAHGAVAPLLLTHPKLRHGILERLSWAEPVALDSGPRAWFHGASAGDLLALGPTLRALKKLRPEVVPLMSTITNSGHAIGEKEFRDVPLRYAPYDLPGATRRAMAHVRPRVLVLEYTELWPNLMYAAKGIGARIVLHNGRFSERNLGNYRLLFRAFGNLLAEIDLFLMRDEEEAARAIKLGALAERVRVTGNTKFDNLRLPTLPPPAMVELREKLAWAPDDPVWIWGSTHEGEEDKLAAGYRQLKARWPKLKLIIAPRYIERAPKLREHFGGCLRSRAVPGADVVVLDTIGELFHLYDLATLVFIGGSFVLRGGQNILEPAVHGKPVTFGPHMENFADSVQVLLGRGGTQVKDPEQLMRVTAELLERPDEIAKLGEMARHAVLSVRGAAERNAHALEAFFA